MVIFENRVQAIIHRGRRLQGRVENLVDMPHLLQEAGELTPGEFPVDHPHLKAARFRLIMKGLSPFLELTVETGRGRLSTSALPLGNPRQSPSVINIAPAMDPLIMSSIHWVWDSVPAQLASSTAESESTAKSNKETR